MKIVTSSIATFIADFNLVKSDGIIFFNAIVKFTSNHRNIEILTEVQIVGISAKEENVIYLLNPAVSNNQIPDMFDNTSAIAYDGSCLSINGYSPVHGPYTLKICSE